MLFLDTGLRLPELASFEISDIHFERGTVLVRKGKGRKQRILHLGNRCQRTLGNWLVLSKPGEDAPFLSDDGQPLAERGIGIWFKRLCEKAHIMGRHGVHRLRHTFAVEFLRAGGDAMNLQYLLGHTSLGMVKRYSGSLDADDAIRAHGRFCPMDRLQLQGACRALVQNMPVNGHWTIASAASSIREHSLPRRACLLLAPKLEERRTCTPSE